MMNKTIVFGLMTLIATSFVSAACWDSDNGWSPYQSGFLVSDGVLYSDKCVAQETQVLEYACVDGQMTSQVYQCYKDRCQSTYYYSISNIYDLNSWIINSQVGQCVNFHGGNRIGSGAGYTPTIVSLPTVLPLNQTNNTTQENNTQPPIPPNDKYCKNNHDCSDNERCTSHTCKVITCKPTDLPKDHDCRKKQGHED